MRNVSLAASCLVLILNAFRHVSSSSAEEDTLTISRLRFLAEVERNAGAGQRLAEFLLAIQSEPGFRIGSSKASSPRTILRRSSVPVAGLRPQQRAMKGRRSGLHATRDGLAPHSLQLPSKVLSRRTALALLAAFPPFAALADGSKGLLPKWLVEIFVPDEDKDDKPKGFFPGAFTPPSKGVENATVNVLLNQTKVTSRCYLDVGRKGFFDREPKRLGRIVVDVYGEVVPKTAENFRQVCSGEAGASYAGTEVFKVTENISMQAGAIEGFGSIYGKTFPHENYKIAHNARGIVSMLNSGVGGYQEESDHRFFFQLAKNNATYLDGRYVAFGKVSEGFDLLKLIEKGKVNSVNKKPYDKTVIIKSGLLPVPEGYGLNRKVEPPAPRSQAAAMTTKPEAAVSPPLPAPAPAPAPASAPAPAVSPPQADSKPKPTVQQLQAAVDTLKSVGADTTAAEEKLQEAKDAEKRTAVVN